MGTFARGVGRFGSACAMALLIGVLHAPGAQAQEFHGVTVQKGCIGPVAVDPLGIGIARRGDQITCVVRVINADEAGHTIRLTSVVDVVKHTSGDVSSGNLITTPVDLVGLGASQDFAHTELVLASDTSPLVDEATAIGTDLGDDGTGTDPVSGMFQAAVTIIDCIADTECNDQNSCTDDTCVAGACIHTPVPGRVCRPAMGACDAVETCDVNGNCPVDGFSSSSVVCRPASGVCDVAENCTGTGPNCPADGFASSATVCRPSAGVCDPAENCTGAGPNCPADGFASSATVCRPSAGVCDPAENCTGSSASCPADVLSPSTTVCRPSAGICDVAENCTGTGPNCPADGFQSTATVCRPSAGDCDVAENCPGNGSSCPPDGFKPSTTVCRASGGVCDPAEQCPGTSATCPPDGKSPPGTTCRAPGALCDRVCDGVSMDCPSDCPDAAVLLSTSTPSITAGETAIYDIQVSANGPGSSTTVRLTDTLPANLTWTVGGPNGGSCSIGAGNVLTCNFGTMAQGTVRQVSVSAVTGAANCGTIQTTATITADIDTNAANNTSGPVPIQIKCPDAGVVLTTSTPSITAGETAVYNMVVTANGPGTSKNVVLTNPLPAGLTWTPGGPDAGACTVGAGNVLTCNFGTMNPGTSKVVNVSAPTGLANCGTLTDTASITATIDTVAANNTSGPVTIDVRCPDVAVTLTTPTPTINVGEPAIYNIVVTANGPGTSKNVVLTTPLPPGLTWTVGGPGGPACSISAANLLTCNYGELPPGTSRQITVTATPGGASCGTMSATSTVTATLDAVPSNNVSGPVPIQVNCPDVGVTLTTPTPSINAGDTARYEFVVTANGPGPSNGVVLSAPLPGGLTWILSGPDSGSCTVNASNQLACTFGIVPQGATRRVTASAETTTASCGQIETTATVAATVDTNADNNVSGPVPIVIACSGGCRVTGGGWINGVTDLSTMAENRTAHFGGQVGAPCGCIGCFDEFGHIQGNFQYDRKTRKGTLHAKDYNSLVCALDGGDGPAPPPAPANKVCFSGVADYNPTNGNKTVRVAFRVDAEDRGEPGRDDALRMRIWVPTPGENVDVLADQACCTKATPTARTPDVDEGSTLVGGNIQIHPELRKSVEGQCPVPRGACFEN